MRLRTLSTALAVVCFASVTHAQSSASDAALATELFNAGRDLMKAGDAAAACPKLAESARLDPKVGTFARLAECEEQLGHLTVARSHWQHASNLARATNDPRAQRAEQELTRIDKIVAKIEIALDPPAPDGLVLNLDQAQLGAGSVGVRLPVDPGPHTLTAAAPGKKPWSTRFDASADGVVTRIRIPVLEAAVPTAEAPSPAIPAPSATPRSGPPSGVEQSPFPWRTVGIGVAAVGVVGVGLGTIFALSAKSKRDESNQPGGCVGNDCPQPAADTRNAARAAGNVATVAFAAGGVLAAAGIAMIVVAPSAPRPTARAVPMLGDRSAGVALEGRW